MHLFTLEQEVDHLLLQQLAVLGIHHVEFLFINQHGLFVLPLRPGFFGDLVIDAFSQFAGVQLKILTFCFTLQESNKKYILLINTSSLFDSRANRRASA